MSPDDLGTLPAHQGGKPLGDGWTLARWYIVEPPPPQVRPNPIRVAMPFWKKSRDGESLPPHVVEAHRLSEALARLEGSLPCSEKDCPSSNGVPCQYVDRRNRTCRSAWCPSHRIVMDGQVYCRRHAGVVSALPRGQHSASPLPDLENRAPSLVSWVARELDADIRSLLLDEVDTEAGAQLLADPVYLIFIGPERRRAWERAWKLATHTGTQYRVALQVEEDADAEVAIKVGSNVLDRMVPPWIVQRLHGGDPAPTTDAEQRKDFNRRVLDVVHTGLEHEREVARMVAREDQVLRGIYRGGDG